MPSEACHIAVANKNQSTLEYLILCASDHPEWIVTVAFYKAVHIVEAVFANHRRWHSQSHDQRLTSLTNLSEFRPIHKHLHSLYNTSRMARYMEDGVGRQCNTFSDYLYPDRVVPEMVNRRLKSVEDESLKFLSDAAKIALRRFG